MEKKQQIQIGGNNSTNYQIEQVNLYQSGLEYRVLDLLNDERFIEAEREINRALRMISVSHIDPNLAYNIAIENDEVHITASPRDKNHLDNEHQQLEVRMIIPEQYRKYESFNEIIEYGRQKQIVLEFDLLEMKTFINGNLTEHLVPTNGKHLVMRIPPIPYPIIVCTLSMGGNALINELWLQIQEIVDDSTIKVSNYNQPNCPIYLVWTIDFNTRVVNLNFSIPENMRNRANSRLLFEGMLDAIQATLLCEVRIIENGLVFFKGTVNKPESLNNISPNIKLYQDIVKIENYFDIVFDLPGSIYSDDCNKISKLIKIIDTGVIHGQISNEFCMELKILDDSKDHMQGILAEDALSIMMRRNDNIELFNQVIDLGIVEVSVEGAKTKDIERLKQKIELADIGEVIKIYFQPIKESKYYEKYLEFLTLDEESIE